MIEKVKLGILSIYLSVDGEANVYGPGTPTVFVRTRGCSVGCHWCDTKYSWSNKGGEEFLPYELVKAVGDVGRDVRKVTLTGGEPLEQNWIGLYLFVRLLIEKGYHITVETAGTQDTLRFRRCLIMAWPKLDITFANLSFIVDYKLQSSKFKGAMDLLHFANLCHGDVVKFVIGSNQDLHEASSIAHYLNCQSKFGARMYFSPMHGNMEGGVLVAKMRKLGLLNIGVGLNMQLHKYAWPEDARMEEDAGIDFTKRGLGRDEFLRRIREPE